VFNGNVSIVAPYAIVVAENSMTKTNFT